MGTPGGRWDIRPLRPADRGQWLALRTALWPDCPPDQHQTDMDAILADPGRKAVFVSTDPDGSLNGFVEVSLREEAEGCQGRPVGYIEGWFVAQGARRKGLGRALVAAAERWAQSRGCREIASDTEVSNQVGQAAHLALGFEEVERTVHYRKVLQGGGESRVQHPPLVVGVDLVEVPRVEQALHRYGERFLRRVFTPAEVVYCRGRVPELAARFAAKEAAAKALGIGVRMLARDGVEWQEVEVLGDQRGRPVLSLYGRAAERAAELGITQWAVSLSHTRQYAIACVVAR